MSQRLKDPSLLHCAAYVDGRWIDSGAQGRYDLFNPSTGERLAQLPRFSAADTRRAIEAAHRAWGPWKVRTAKERADILRRWYELILDNRDDLATLITLEEGKPLTEARGEVDYAASFVQWFSEEARRVYGEVIPAPRPGARIVVLKEPVGVCAAITPWNFPAAMVTRKAAPALAAGCTMVLKPAEQTPLTSLALAHLAERAGVPAGVFNVVSGSLEDAPPIGVELTGNELVRKITFTGSTTVGRILLAQSASTIKRASMELGGNAPFIVFDDANLDQAVEGLLVAKFRNTGQSCVGANRVLVQDAVYEAFADKFAQRMKTLKVGDGFTEGAQIGPLIDKAAVKKVQEHLDDARAKGGQVLAGGKPHSLGGLFFEPTVLTQAHPDMLLAREETFGPLAALFRFKTEQEAIDLANSTPFGLASYFYSENAGRIWRVAGGIESGMIGINTGFISNEVAPFGGVKQSGLGREGSRHGIDEFVETKYLCWQGG